ncbi:MAG: glycosyl transferase, partial [Acidobacteria bacterium]
QTKAKLVPCAPESLRLSRFCEDQLAHHFVSIEKVYTNADQFDILHFHLDYLHYPVSKRQRIPHVTTLHGRLDMPDLQPLYEMYPDIPLISISNSQREPLPNVNWIRTIYHGLPEDTHSFRPNPGKYLVFLGRISPEKRCDRAIRISKKTGIRLKIAAKVSRKDQEYHDQIIKPMLNHPAIEFVGEVNEREKDDLLGNALALLFPIDWPEPFGLVMIEAMACGTPVIAYRNGSVEEIVEHGKNGFIVDELPEAIHAVENIPSISRMECRNIFERRFSAARMAREYVEVYKELIEAKKDVW